MRRLSWALYLLLPFEGDPVKRQRILGMNAHFVLYLLLPFAIVLLAPFFFLLINGAAFRQRPDQVVTREPGMRILGKPVDAGNEARDDVEFALLSQAVYQNPVDNDKIKEGKALDPCATLKQMGWEQWETFPNGDLKKTFDAVHLRLQVWSNRSQKKVVVAFGGTVFRNLKDWRSDLRWFIPHHHDEYTAIVEKLGDAFLKEYLKQENEGKFPPQSDIFSTGHSLGGGLAHQFAYSLPVSNNVPRVKKVYAFDPSPVTGYYSVDEGLRDGNSELLNIDRIYERGEILAFFRALTNLVYPPSATKPAIRQVRYSLFYTLNPFAGHSMAEFAFRMHKVANGEQVP
jgi:pimeloyl-ACP methyl ester carboxylesterase